MKLCKDCVSYSVGYCANDNNTRPDFVNGGKTPIQSPQFLREHEKIGFPERESCGPDARWFEPREQGAE